MSNNDLKEIINIDLTNPLDTQSNTLAKDEGKPVVEVEPKPEPEIKQQPENKNPEPPITTTPIAKPVETYIPPKAQVIPEDLQSKEIAESIEKKQKGKKKNIDNGYLYNKSTIGGIDQTKLEYKETFKKKIYFNAPTHRYSWIILGILVIFLLGGTGFYFYYPEIAKPLLGIQEPNIIQDNKPKPTEETKPAINNQGLREKLLQVKAPFLLENDEIIKLYKDSLSKNFDDPIFDKILSKESLININLEFYKIKSIIEEQNAIIKNETQQKSESSEASQNTQE